MMVGRTRTRKSGTLPGRGAAARVFAQNTQAEVIMPTPDDPSLHPWLLKADDDRRLAAARPRAEGLGLTDGVARLFAALITVDVVGADALRLQHGNGQSGFIAADDILAGRLRVVDPRSGEISEYEHIEAIVVGGWSVAT